MAKRRTKKDKVRRSKSIDLASSVKGQFKKPLSASISKTQRPKNANLLAQEGSFKTVRSDIIKSLILASFILSLELVVYLVRTVL